MKTQDQSVIHSAAQRALWVVALAFVVEAGAYLLSTSVAIFAAAVGTFAVFVQLWRLACETPNANTPDERSTRKGKRFSFEFFGAAIVATGIIALGLSLYRLSEPATPGFAGAACGLLCVATLPLLWLARSFFTTAQREHLMPLRAAGQTVLAGCYASLFVIVGLLLGSYTGAPWLDPLFGGLLSLGLVVAGIKIWLGASPSTSERSDPAVARQLTELLSQRCAQYGISFRELRHHNQGDRHSVDLRLVFPSNIQFDDAHKIAAEIEVTLISALSNRAHILTSLESGE